MKITLPPVKFVLKIRVKDNIFYAEACKQVTESVSNQSQCPNLLKPRAAADKDNFNSLPCKSGTGTNPNSCTTLLQGPKNVEHLRLQELIQYK